MAFPSEPSVPLPTWATDSGATKVDPGSVKRAEGWVNAGPGIDYGEAPPFPWVNNEAYNNGEWATYFQQALNYIKTQQNSQIIINNITSTTGTIIGSNVLYSKFIGSTPYNTSSGIFTSPITGLVKIEFNFALSQNLSSDLFGLRIQFISTTTKVVDFYSNALQGNPPGALAGNTFSGFYYYQATVGEQFEFTGGPGLVQPITINVPFAGLYSSTLSFTWNI